MGHTTADQHFKRAVLRRAPGLRRRRRQMLVASIALYLIFVPLFLAITVFTFWLWLGGSTPADELPMAMLSAALTSLLTIAILAAPISGWVALGKEWRRRRSIAALGDRIGWHYEPEVAAADYNGLLFRVGNGGRVENELHRHEPRFLEVGNYSYSTSQLENPRTEVGFVAVQLPRRLPHMYLQSRVRQTRARAIQLPFRQDQRLSLEGDFDRWFHLYCPREYERDALYVFTPDLMAALIDNVEGCDVEVADEWLYVYAREPFDLTGLGAVAFAERIDATLGSGAERQTRHYSDDRSARPAFVHESGSRLRWRRGRIVGLSALAGTAVWAVVFAVMYVTGQF